ncbi:hypothetical protein [Halobellus rarus]|uniref:DUF8165 domain-containing protein n=1 Tax=Halobellus rarus TaxID=1126237 RepID=A0ABD6CQM6_9EURY|nr:hypothetical protein [Halobellus rarus]
MRSHTESTPQNETPTQLYRIHNSIPYSSANRIRTCDTLADGATAVGATAYYRYRQTPAENVVAAHPDGWATAMHLGSLTMTAVSLEAVPADILTKVQAVTDCDVESYSLLVLGRPPTSPNQSLESYDDHANDTDE